MKNIDTVKSIDFELEDTVSDSDAGSDIDSDSGSADGAE
jgi:hypothetical protein